MKFIFSLALSVLSIGVYAQKNEIKGDVYIGCIGFYNIENLFDTIDGPNDDAEFLPGGLNNWIGKYYKDKLEKLSTVLSDIGTEVTPDGAAVIGLAEVENRGVLEDLVKTAKLKKRNYKIIHYDSPDARGVDVALLYQEKYFKPVSSKPYRVVLPYDSSHATRDVLLVSGMFDGEMMHYLVNHWPSRRGGEKRSAPGRWAAAKVCRNIIDSLLLADPKAKIILMGDLNDDPVDESVTTFLNAKGKRENLKQGELYNVSYDNFKKGIGTLGYRDAWNLFDQMIISQGLLDDKYATYTFHKYKIFNKPYVIEQEGQYKGYGKRTFSGGTYHGGYSDHFAVYVFLMKKK